MALQLHIALKCLYARYYLSFSDSFGYFEIGSCVPLTEKGLLKAAFIIPFIRVKVKKRTKIVMECDGENGGYMVEY